MPSRARRRAWGGGCDVSLVSRSPIRAFMYRSPSYFPTSIFDSVKHAPVRGPSLGAVQVEDHQHIDGVQPQVAEGEAGGHAAEEGRGGEEEVGQDLEEDVAGEGLLFWWGIRVGGGSIVIWLGKEGKAADGPAGGRRPGAGGRRRRPRRW